jgi:hypothetical protein
METYMLRIPVILFALTTVCITACTKDDTLTANCIDQPGRTCVGYHETYCADPWRTGSETDEEIIDQLLDFLASAGIDLTNVKIVDTHPAEACLACSCESGRTIFGAVGDADLEAIEEIGFVQQ